MKKQNHEIKANETTGSVLIVVESPEGILLVKDPQQKDPLFWKFPGGKVKIWLCEKHKEAAVRELKEETGLEVKPEQLRILDYKRNSEHILTVFGTRVESLDGVLKIGKSGEITKISTLEGINKLKDFHPNHREILNFWKNGSLDLSFMQH